MSEIIITNSNGSYVGQDTSGGRSNYLYLSAQLGNPVFSDFQTSQFNYTDPVLGTVTVESITIEKALYTVKFPKHIIKTEINGRNGSVKEYISSGDAEINIKGTIYGANGTYPEDDVLALLSLCQAPVSFAVNSWFLTDLQITNIVITDYSIPQEAGGFSYQNFELNCLSDVPVQLLAKQP
jgi:hypothetical protein